MDDLLGLLAGPATVFGHSLGGDIALAAAERRPDLVAAVGAYEPPMPWEPWWPDNTAGGDALRKGDGAAASPEAAAEAFMRRMIGDRLWDGLPSATREERRAEGVTLVEELADLRRARPYAPEQIQVPVLVARGEHAGPQHRQGTTRLAAQLASAGRSAPLEVVEVPGVGHGIHLEDPAAMAGLVRRLVAVSRS